MTPATKEKSLVGQLAKLEADNEKDHAQVRQDKREEQEREAHIAALRGEYTARCHEYPEELDKARMPKKGTEAARLRDEIDKLRDGPSPAQKKLGVSLPKFHGSGNLARRFRVANFEGIVAELIADIDKVESRFEQAFHEIAEAADAYGLLVEVVREFVIDSPGLDGQALTYDPRVNDWRKLAETAMDDPLIRPGLTELGAWKLDQVRQHEAAEAQQEATDAE